MASGNERSWHLCPFVKAGFVGREARESHPPAPERTICRQVLMVRSKVKDHNRLPGYIPCHSRIRERGPGMVSRKYVWADPTEVNPTTPPVKRTFPELENVKKKKKKKKKQKEKSRQLALSTSPGIMCYQCLWPKVPIFPWVLVSWDGRWRGSA